MNILLRWRISVAAWCLVLILMLIPGHSLGQASSENQRKLVTRVAPEYPSLARSMAIQGSVKADVLVAPNGTVKSIEIKGGHPVFVKAVENALREWKWEPAPHETHELVELKFKF